MSVTPWAAPSHINYGNKLYTRLLDLQDPSMVPAGFGGTLDEYANFYGFMDPDQWWSLAALPPCAGVQDHQPRFLPAAQFTTTRDGVYWLPTDYTYRGAGTAQFMVPYEATDVLVVYPFHEVEGADWGKGMDAFAYDPPSYSTVHEFSRPYASQLEPASNLYFGDGVGVFHSYSEGENNWIHNDFKWAWVGGVRNGWQVHDVAGIEMFGVEMRFDWEWFMDSSHYDAFAVAPLQLEPDNNFFVLEYNIYLPRSVQPAYGDPGFVPSGTDSFVRPFFYSAVGGEEVPGTISVSGDIPSGVHPSLPVH